MPRIPLTNLTDPVALACFLLTAIVGLTVDLWTKWYAFETLVYQVIVDATGSHPETRPPYRFIPGWLEFHAHTNDGAVFGIGQGHTSFFIIVSIVALGVLSSFFLISGRQRLYQFILGLLLAGVLGNMYDRVTLGYVRDMIHVLPKWGLFPWIFNVADCLLCIGVGLMVVYSWLHARTMPSGASASEAAAPDAR
jgi:signal peptidase II